MFILIAFLLNGTDYAIYVVNVILTLPPIMLRLPAPFLACLSGMATTACLWAKDEPPMRVVGTTKALHRLATHASTRKSLATATVRLTLLILTARTNIHM
jgi:hypothetical protein